ncbi:hypothetical protein L210DRAFT_3509847 [Boletus edulis BED1]|uniref:Uncharacterized protein n=1 Tax=Boletus edulis BED1 TaxID=1328754 RepID=A0AAD4BEK6_BOLED|nr:hypothetical protein L210DRAFT_3509847 [Boletus edulis BED1]
MVNEEKLQVLKTLLDRKWLTEADVEGDELLQQDTCKEELAVADQKVKNLIELYNMPRTQTSKLPMTSNSSIKVCHRLIVKGVVYDHTMGVFLLHVRESRLPVVIKVIRV